ncbi:MAG: hypothetical protein DRN83_02770 [Hadesarchaea archaeon]|nr:MAG: hypothetical protein DRN83_02770 [Hadesarchaea archaeon]
MKTKVHILKEVPEIKLVRRQLGSFARGDEVELWTWDAIVLERHGVAESVQKLEPAELRKLILAEERNLSIEPLPDDFYRLAAQRISILREAGKSKRADELREQILALVEIRLPKLLRLALSPGEALDLPVEEHFLINRLADTLDGWIERLSALLERSGEEVEKHEPGKSVQRIAGDETNIQKSGIPSP